MTYAQGKSIIRLAVLVFAVAALFLPPRANAQTRDLAEVHGHVQDAQDKAVAGAQVTLTNKDTGISRDTQTGSDGNYSFLGIPLTGHYSVGVKASSFSPPSAPTSSSKPMSPPPSISRSTLPLLRKTSPSTAPPPASKPIQIKLKTASIPKKSRTLRSSAISSPASSCSIPP